MGLVSHKVTHRGRQCEGTKMANLHGFGKGTEALDSKLLLEQYRVTREKLAAVSVAKSGWNAGQLQEVLQLLSSKPGSETEHGGEEWVKGLIKKMEALIPKASLKKPCCK